MAYIQAHIDEKGLYIPEYTDIRDDILQIFRQIYGQDIYLENDAQDYQFISIIARRHYDALLAVQDGYNARSPRTAIGTSLDGVVAINGIKRKQPSKSFVKMKLLGKPSTIIQNGAVGDDFGNIYNLPSRVELDSKGEAVVTAYCQKTGPITAYRNSITNIITPTQGWTSTTNIEPAIPGQDLETDPFLRARQAISTANPSRSVLQGTIGAIAGVLGVKRYKVYENDTSITDDNGIPSHSISAVVEGGENDTIAQLIYLHKTTGGGTYGDTEIIIPKSVTGEVDTPIHFWNLTYIDIEIQITVKKLTGYTSAVYDEMKQQLLTYINNLPIGEDFQTSWIWATAICKTTDEGSYPTFSIQDVVAGEKGNSLSDSIIKIPYNKAVRCDIVDIKVIEQ